MEENVFRSLWENMAIASCIDEIVYHDGRPVDYRLLDVNPAWERLTGIPRSKAAGALATRLYGTETAPLLDLFARVAESGEPASFETFFAPIGKHLLLNVSCPARGRFSALVTDLSERKQMEQAHRESEHSLRLSEEKFSAIFRSSPDAFFLTSVPDGRIVEMNAAAERLAEHPHEEMIGRTTGELCLWANPQARDECMARIVAEGAVRDFETRFRKRNGDLLEATVSGELVRIQGEPYFLSVIRDIGDRKHAELVQRCSQKRVRALLELFQLRDVSETELIGFALEHLVDITESKIAFLGTMDLEERVMTAQLWSRQASEDCRTDSRTVTFDVETGGIWAEAIRSRRPFLVNEYDALGSLKGGLPEGHVPLKSFLGVPALKEGRVVLVAGMANKEEPYDESDQDEARLFLEGLLGILGRREAERHLVLSKERLAQAVTSGNVGLWDWDLRADRLHFSREWKTQIGYEEDELPDAYETWESRLHPDDRALVMRRLEECRNFPERLYKVEFRLRHRDGGYRWILSQAQVRLDPEGRPAWILGSHIDITQTRAADAALEQERANLVAVMASAPVPLMVFDEDETLVMANPAACRAFGQDATELLGLRCGAFIRCARPVNDPRGCGETVWCEACGMNRALHAVVSGSEGLRDLEVVVKSALPDGPENRWYVVSVEPLVLGGHRRAIVTLNDITKRKQAEKALIASEERYRGLVEYSPDAVFLNVDDRVVFVNRAALVLFGANDASLLLGRSSYDLFDPGYHERMRERVASLKLGNTVPTMEARILRLDGALVDVEVVASPIEEGGHRSIQVILRDIRERKRAEQALKESEQRLRALYEESPLAYQSLNEQGCILDVNPRWLELFGYSREEVLGRWFGAFLAEESDIARLKERFQGFLVEGRLKGEEYVLRKKDGTTLIISMDGRTAIGTDGRFRQTHCLLRDVTEEKRLALEKERFEAVARQQQKLEAIGTLASGVAHEINNPLNVILNFGQLTLDNPNDPVLVEDFAGNIVKESERVAVIVRNLLSFARQERENHSLARVEDIIEKTLSLTRAVLRKDQIVVTTEIAEALPTVNCRSQQIQQVIMNLLTNARDALNQRFPKASPDKTIRIVARTFEKDGASWVRITVQDQGTGISPEVANRVFDPFFTTKDRDKGTGLGLSISYGIVREHHGEISFESQPGVGTSFHVDLKVDDA